MFRQKLTYSLLISLFIITLILAGTIFYSRNETLTVNFLDVGQGDSILISVGSKQVLIDGGPNGQIMMEKLGKYVPFWDRQIEVVIVTHPDQDHIAGIVDVLENYKVEKVIDNGQEADSEIYKKYKELIGDNNIERLAGTLGYKIKLNSNAQMNIISPFSPEEPSNLSDDNDKSLVSKLIFGDNSFLFVGDISTERESTLLSLPLALDSRVLKIAHHGSKHSTSSDFLSKIDPEEAIISVGEKNRYGHPAPELLERLEKEKIEILRTDQRGDIKYECRSDNECILSH